MSETKYISKILGRVFPRCVELIETRVLERLHDRLTDQMEESFDPELSRKVDAVNILLGRL